MNVNGTLVEEKSTTERQLEKAKKRVEELKARRRAEIQAINKSNRKRRTRQLIKIGATLAKAFNIDPLKDDPAQIEKFLSQNVLGAVTITKNSETPINIIDLWREYVQEERKRQNGTESRD